MIERLDVVLSESFSERAIVCEILDENAKIQLESNLIGEGKIETHIVSLKSLTPIKPVIGQIVLLKEEHYMMPQPRWKVTKHQTNGKFVIVHANESGQRAIVVNPSQIAICIYETEYEFPVSYPIEAREPAVIRVFGGKKCRVLVSYDSIGDVVAYHPDGTPFKEPSTGIPFRTQRPKDVNWIEYPALIKQGKAYIR